MSDVLDNQQEKLTFEEAFAQLEDIVRRLESGALALEDSLALFERGQRLAIYCNTRLDEADLKIQQLTSSPGDASPGDAPHLSLLSADEVS